MGEKMKHWDGLLTIIEIQHRDSHGNLLWESKDIKNLLHQDGEEFMLRAAFTGGQNSTIIPENYYLGLDSRTTLFSTDTMDDLVGEPSSGGYERQTISSEGDFSINFQDSHFIATSPIVVFRATAGSWGPVRNLFLTTQDDDSGYLISTAPLDSLVSLTAGDSVTLRISLRIRGCTS